MKGLQGEPDGCQCITVITFGFLIARKVGVLGRCVWAVTAAQATLEYKDGSRVQMGYVRAGMMNSWSNCKEQYL